jgi:protein TonB
MIRLLSELRPSALAGLALVVALGFVPFLTRVSAAGPVSSISPPAPLKREFPGYPRGAQKRGIEGWVLLEFTVDERGAVVAPRVVEAVPPGIFDAIALEAITKWKYEPAMDGGKAVVAPGMRVKLNFQLKDE